MSSISDATLYNRGGGLIYDDVLDITWLQDGNVFNRDDIGWAEGLGLASSFVYYDSVRHRYTDDWRLPSPWNYDGSSGSLPCIGYNCTKSEMGHLFYEELENIAPYSGCTQGVDCGLVNKGPFDNIYCGHYWLASYDGDLETWDFLSRDDPNDYDPWFFNMNTGRQNWGDCITIWLVHDGDVPEPATLLLLGAGVLGLAGLRRKIKKTN